MVKLIKCSTPESWEYIRVLRTDKSISKYFASQPTITVEQQVAYMSTHQENYRLIVDDLEYIVGFIGQVDGDIRIAIEKIHQNKGYGSEAISLFVKEFKDIKLTAKIKLHNEASINAFENAGFRKSYFILET